MTIVRRRVAWCFVAALIGGEGVACTPPHLEPDALFREASAVVLAEPISQHFTPPAASSERFDGVATERIEWQTYVSWKGRWASESIFTTARTYPVVSDGPCGPSWRPGQLYRKGPWLLFLYGDPPYARFETFHLREAFQIFRFLDRP